jgi:hypothetical protein
MAQAIRIPPQYKPGLVKLRAMSEDSFQELLVALRDAPPSISSDSLLPRLRSAVSSLSPQDIGDVVPAIVSLYPLRAQLNSLPPDVAESVVRAMEEDEESETEFTGEMRGRFKERLIALLSLDSLDVAEKASNLLFEHEHTLREARIVTDIRPVFGENPEDPPAGAVIVHMLKLGYYEGSIYRELFVALDDSDIRVLQDLLARAESKAEALKSVLEAAKVPYVDVE